ncbi:MAG: hypothetical protein KC549_17915, partial [Myxococcales bacterium]|nr:hypothetical protein [Myxococcales bacterium]
MAPAGPPPELLAWLDAQLGRWARDAARIADPGRKLAFAQGARELLASWDQSDATPPVVALTRLYTQAGLPPPSAPTPAQIAQADALRGPAALGRLRQSLADLIRLNQRAISEVLAELAQVAAEVIQPAAPAPAPDPAAVVRVVIVTALPLEDAAVQVVLGLDTPWFSPGPVQRSYHLGRVSAAGGGHHHVALATLPDMANNLAAVVTGHLAHHFPGHRRVILCGIAGGVPRPGESEHDVRLGDVVYSGRGGVVQFDLVKEYPDATREHRHPPRAPDARVLDATRRLEAGRRLGKRPWEAFLPMAAQLEGATRPADDADARGEPIQYPPDPARRPGLPRVFGATIAASNTLLKNPAHRDYLGKTFGAKAVEMEGSGVADAAWEDGRAGYFVVRGICDYCDAKKGDVWQPYAAVAAAAYLRALLEAMPADA